MSQPGFRKIGRVTHSSNNYCITKKTCKRPSKEDWKWKKMKEQRTIGSGSKKERKEGYSFNPQTGRKEAWICETKYTSLT